MNGREIENLLRLIDENVASTTAQLDEELIDYVKQHQAEVLAALRSGRQYKIPTSLGPVSLHPDQLTAAAA